MTSVANDLALALEFADGAEHSRWTDSARSICESTPNPT